MKYVTRYAKDFATVFTGGVVSQLAIFLFSPFLARLYTPDMFGSFAVFMASVAILIPISSLRYEQAIVMADTDSDADSLLTLSLLSAFTVSFGCYLVFAAIALSTDSASSFSPSKYPLLAAAGVLTASSSNILRCHLIRERKFKVIANSLLFRSVLTISCQAALFRMGAIGLIAGNVIAAAGASLAMAKYSRIVTRSRPELRQVIKEYRDFPLFNMPQGLCTQLIHSAPAFTLTYVAGPAAAGLHAMAVRILHRPTTAIIDPMRAVFSQRASELNRTYPEQVNSTYRKNTALLVTLISIPALAVVAAGPAIFELLLGDQWRSSGEYARWVLVAVISSLLNVPAVELTKVYRMQKKMLVFQLVHSIVRTSVLIGFCLAFGAISGIAASSLAAFIFAVVLILSMDRVTRKFQTEKQVSK